MYDKIIENLSKLLIFFYVGQRNEVNKNKKLKNYQVCR